MSTVTVTSTANAVDTSGAPRLRLVGSSGHEEGSAQQPSTAEASYNFAAPHEPRADPERYWAGNMEDWDYAQGNPINPMWQGQNTAIRPNNGDIVQWITCGVNVIGYLNSAWKNTVGRIDNTIFRYPVSIEEGF